VELPRLAAFWAARRDRCFELVGVAGMSGRSEVEEAAKAIPFPVLFDYDGDSLDAWSVLSFPRTFVIDAEGRVRREFRGVVDEQELARTVDPLLPPSCPGRSG
jgi:peroxiredoxin